MLILRGISGTFAYFYKGSAEKLDVAVWIMAKVQLDIDLSRGSLYR
jgi:cytochrome c peroxidase